MYTLKPYYDSSMPVDLPNCMYRMKTTSGNLIAPSQNSASEMDVGYLATLENRQEDILRRLELLKVEVAGLVKSTETTQKSHKESNLVDLVVSADPSKPPLAVLVLVELLATQYKVFTACHCHSSVKNVPDHLRTIFGHRSDTANRGQYNMALTLVWKDVKRGPTLMVNPRAQVLLEGEGTIARHLARLLNPSYEEGDIIKATEIDQWVDTASQYPKGNNKEKNSMLKNMNSKLGKSEWLTGQEPSVADVMMWSVLVHSDGVPTNVKSWIQRCSDRPAFSTVLKKLCII